MTRHLSEIWMVMRICLEAGAPMPEDAREYLIEFVRKLDELNTAVLHGKIAPQSAAAAIPKHLGLTAGAYRSWLRARRRIIAAEVHANNTAQLGRKKVAENLVRQLGVSRSTIFRHRKAQTKAR